MAISNIPSLAEFQSSYNQLPGPAGAVNAISGGIDKGMAITNAIAQRKLQAEQAKAAQIKNKAEADYLEAHAKSLFTTPNAAGLPPATAGMVGPDGQPIMADTGAQPIPTAIAARQIAAQQAAANQASRAGTQKEIAGNKATVSKEQFAAKAKQHLADLAAAQKRTDTMAGASGAKTTEAANAAVAHIKPTGGFLNSLQAAGNKLAPGIVPAPAPQPQDVATQNLLKIGGGQSSAPVKVSTQAEYDALPVGAQFIDSTGKVATKKGK